MRNADNRVWIERLEVRRLLAAVTYNLIADTIGGGWASLGQGPSINDGGVVAFTGQHNLSGVVQENVYAHTPARSANLRLMDDAYELPISGATPTQTFGSRVQVNNLNQVLTQRQLNAYALVGGVFSTVPLTYLETWDATVTDGLPLQRVVGAYPGSTVIIPAILDPIWAWAYPSPLDVGSGYDGLPANAASINDRGEVAFGAIRGSEWFRNTAPHTSGPPYLGGSTGTALTRPRISGNASGDYVLATSGTVYVETFNFSSFGSIAGASTGVTAAGNSPGISDDGVVTAFNANLSAANTMGVGGAAAGPGLSAFVNTLVGGTRRSIKIAGVAGNGFFDPFETGDTNGNGRVDTGETESARFSSIDLHSPVAVNQQPGQGRYTTLFKAINTAGQPGLYGVSFRLDATSPQGVSEMELFVVAGDGDALPGFGPVTDVATFDGINASGDIVFWARSGMREGILTRHAQPAVFVVATHGFGREMTFDLSFGRQLTVLTDATTMAAPFRHIVNVLRDMPENGTLLDDQVSGIAPTWESSDGFVQSLVARALQATASALPPSPLRASAFLWRYAADAYAARSARNAEIAARDIAAQVRAAVPDPATTRDNTRRIMLIGHSRGGAVNARVAQLLVADGYRINNYTALDGYSTDWPFPSNLIGDIPIESTINSLGADVSKKVNYRVEQGLAGYGFDAAIGALNTSLASFAGVSDALDPSFVSSVISAIADWRAPNRFLSPDPTIVGYPGAVAHDGRTVSGVSHHLNVTDYYAASGNAGASPPDPRYIQDNYIGANRNTPAPSAVADVEPSSASIGVAPPPAGVAGVSDGSFQSVGPQYADNLAGAFYGESQPGIGVLVSMLRDPRYLLSQVWDVEGDVTLHNNAGNWSARLAQTALDGTTLGQDLLVPADATTLKFDFAREFAAAGDRLQVTLDGVTLADIDLATSASGSPSLTLTSGAAGNFGRLTFRLTGDVVDPSVVRLDNIRTVGADTVAPSGTAAYRRDDLQPTIGLSFSEDVSASLSSADVSLVNLTTGATYPSANLTVRYNAFAHTADLRLTGALLADGQWRMTLPRSTVTDAAGNPLAGDVVLNISVLAGDANGDHRVDVADLGIVAANFRGVGKTYSQGDFNYDGAVDVADLGALAANFRMALPASLSSVTTSRPAVMAAAVNLTGQDQVLWSQRPILG